MATTQNKMKKLTTILGAALFLFALTLSSCGGDAKTAVAHGQKGHKCDVTVHECDGHKCAKGCASYKEGVACSDDCAKACCLGCHATEGDGRECLADHSCCAHHDSNNPEDSLGNNNSVDVVACADDCQKACCLGCKATEGEASCSLLAAGDHSCCAVHEEVDDGDDGDYGDYEDSGSEDYDSGDDEDYGADDTWEDDLGDDE